ncbi:type II toxin-antitoxin system ParD family antitoxin [Aetokthonos hydrillicola Thurmond2011]|jgi:antitoxin ParD1/3/4|uniref:Type II toxin-antitoxin system ParD family antitoxin n=1 Tax=Aetokthonos hydrillicola Thurmond2011 TaxID=2712845 RepID=A0AAP5M910_9CYAN|nr:type II toxin-antitoxin system ParD family antitoxin [Aetokthonos hydrillicola]MBO3458354.1 type II toxin-antitoxin system ParD family antitoxin [Aetokthonos hydrillicola CCALA 1050]MBW4585919.1 type II toxin-antitoxin system ParD family antitoxin [Aetokthonos hydrillicola CCALA 1050]MDR9893854.1 type II toxin-antitoxin system ParD family antitoxin [Aetokthonos hydrillicola Thurmond2011]
MNVHLGETFDKFVAELLAGGEYQSQSEVIREGLRLLKEREDLRKLRLEELRREIQVGIDQANRGEVVPFDIEDIKAEGRRKLKEERTK